MWLISWTNYCLLPFTERKGSWSFILVSDYSSMRRFIFSVTTVHVICIFSDPWAFLLVAQLTAPDRILIRSWRLFEKSLSIARHMVPTRRSELTRRVMALSSLFHLRWMSTISSAQKMYHHSFLISSFGVLTHLRSWDSLHDIISWVSLSSFVDMQSIEILFHKVGTEVSELIW
jgi:hypothetical protein